ncbi:LysR substrate-binding domain-containing protein [Ruegeria faecimaris]|uniref:DNA-binding transcriptional regulator, LysR family n=1 Tax=Ruegeria faecimaris TaxID=686389 RepID=A0A521CEY3_9RHOB|nr:LysR substrate-binding domain-containing protein [Ruegeria faecimaris]SMO57989.1 DNA-binding transcriptional regulator, LysR family [Ruegeria faecimaris]
MSRRHYNLPPLTTLSAFEAAARHLSFKNAAEELSVTPGAVSHQIKALEGDLGTALFQRKHRGVELTEDGKALYDALASSFTRISKTLATIRDRATVEKVTVGSTTAVAALWLSPSVIRFWREMPEVNVDQLSQDRPFRDRPDIDFFIRYGRDGNGDLSHTPLFRDCLVPVACPEVADRLAGASLEDLAAERLIHLDSEDRSWTTWPEWFQQLGYTGTIPIDSRVNSYSVALQRARKGAGLVLGWQRLIQPMLQSGKLVAIGPHLQIAPNKFYLVGRSDEDLSESARALKDWIIQEVQDGSV